MDARIAPQPPASPDEEAAEPVGAAAPAVSPRDLSGAHDVAMLLFELRRIPQPGSRITPEIGEMVLNRCVLAAIEVLSAAQSAVTMAGTESRPVVEATFQGARSAEDAARAACDVLAGVRRVQRASENEFQVVGAITTGATGRGPSGVTVTIGGPDVLLERLREAAAPGQILMSAAAREACADMVEAVPVHTGPDGSLEAHVLRRMRASGS